jgi:protein SCO1/2
MITRNRLLTLLIGVQMLAGIAGATSVNALPRLPTLERVTVIAVPKTIADFELTDQNGRPRSAASLRGAPALIFFGFTHCPDVCPTALTKLKLLHESNGGALKAARVVFISVDGERDTATALKRYLSALPADFIGLTGNPRTVADIAARFSAVAYKDQPDSQGNYGYFHSSQVFLLDKEGRLRASFSDASLENMTTMTQLVLSE